MFFSNVDHADGRMVVGSSLGAVRYCRAQTGNRVWDCSFRFGTATMEDASASTADMVFTLLSIYLFSVIFSFASSCVAT